MAAQYDSPVFRAPFCHAINDDVELFAVLGHAVFDAGRVAVTLELFEQLVLLHLPQPHGQDFFAESVDGGEDVLETGVPAEDCRENLDGPFAAQDVHGVADGHHLTAERLGILDRDFAYDFFDVV